MPRKADKSVGTFCLANLSARLDGLEASLNERDQEIEELKDAIAAYKLSLGECETEIAFLTDHAKRQDQECRDLKRLSNKLWFESLIPEFGKRPSHSHNRMKADIIKLYRLEDGCESGYAKCQITGALLPTGDLVLGHLFPWKAVKHFKDFNLQSSDDVWSVRNGLVWLEAVEKAFEQFKFVLLRRPGRDEGSGDDKTYAYQLRVVCADLLGGILGLGLIGTPVTRNDVQRDRWHRLDLESISNLEKTWADIDGKFLYFKRRARPYARFLFNHAKISSIIATTLKWENKWDDVMAKTKKKRARLHDYVFRADLELNDFYQDDSQEQESMQASRKIDEGFKGWAEAETDSSKASNPPDSQQSDLSHGSKRTRSSSLGSSEESHVKRARTNTLETGLTGCSTSR